MPDTFLSLDKGNKLRIPFVQGKFNMGGTGALRFCGDEGIQFVMTRRNPAIVNHHDVADATASRWGFTVVRRVRPTPGVGEVRNSVYRYLAPVCANDRPCQGDVLSFEAPEVEALPRHNRAYALPMGWGSVLKLYEYDMKGFGSHALMGDGLLSRLEILLPGIALPVRIHECRAYRGAVERSFENTLVGFNARLEDNRARNLEPGYPTVVPIHVSGEEMSAEVYAFKGNTAKSYRKNEGVIFTVNGQTHGSLSKTFFGRSAVKMQRLANSLLVVVDCSKLSVGAREDLFMNSRDRLSKGSLGNAIESELEELIGRHPGLRALRDERRQQEISERLRDSRPLEEVLASIMKSSPTLNRLFMLGQRLSHPHRAGGNGKGGSAGGAGSERGVFRGRPHPTYFRFHRKPEGCLLERDTEIGRRCRIKFETDVDNEYFGRETAPGRYTLEILAPEIENWHPTHQLNVHNGLGNWSVSLDVDHLEVGQVVHIRCTVEDDTLLEPFVNEARLTIVEPAAKPPGGGTRSSAATERGSGSSPAGHAGGERSGQTYPGGLRLPVIIEVGRDDLNWRRHEFDERTSCKVFEDSAGDDPDSGSVYTFYVNTDNVYLKTEMKGTKGDVALTRAKFVYGNVLVGLALIHDGQDRKPESDDGEDNVTDRIAVTTKALAPFLVPMIDYLGALTSEEVIGLGQLGDED